MKAILAGTMLALISAAFLSGPADAAGCLKGAVVGGVAGHYAGNHGLLGAGVGCAVGRHQANKRARQQMNTNSGYSESGQESSQHR
jgi:predicted transcriptional regulator with HTH domain